MRATERMVGVRSFHFKVFFFSSGVLLFKCILLQFIIWNTTRPNCSGGHVIHESKENVKYQQLVKLDEQKRERANLFFRCWCFSSLFDFEGSAYDSNHQVSVVERVFTRKLFFINLLSIASFHLVAPSRSLVLMHISASISIAFFAFDDPKIPAPIQRPSQESHRMTLTHSHVKNV